MTPVVVFMMARCFAFFFGLPLALRGGDWDLPTLGGVGALPSFLIFLCGGVAPDRVGECGRLGLFGAMDVNGNFGSVDIFSFLLVVQLYASFLDDVYKLSLQNNKIILTNTAVQNDMM
jgi:UDP-N-acetylmuramyl pentapeptide phosphotransferase/UDP-N-acetylglucosamine-1-phosphate transferase